MLEELSTTEGAEEAGPEELSAGWLELDTSGWEELAAKEEGDKGRSSLALGLSGS